ncbi:MAG: tetratricopeptide repeat protein, partial [Paramuribaculum sp.]|nr:tetratricopeptide repeat protein [Paramuribaculum sp.]
KEVDELNRTHALRYLLQVTNREHSLTDPEEINRHFQSIEYYNSYLSTHNPRAIDYFGRAMDQITVRNFQSAMTDLNRAIEAAPDFTAAYLMRANVRNRIAKGLPTSTDNQKAATSIRSEVQEILNDLDTVIRLSPNMAVAHFNKGVILAETGNFTAALDEFNQALEIKPDFGEAYYNRGYTYFQLGNRTAGSADLSKAGELGIVPSYNLLKRMNR